MPCTLVTPEQATSISPLLALAYGTAIPMGDGHFVIHQSDDLGDPQSVVMTTGDLQLLLLQIV